VAPASEHLSDKSAVVETDKDGDYPCYRSVGQSNAQQCTTRENEAQRTVDTGGAAVEVMRVASLLRPRVSKVTLARCRHFTEHKHTFLFLNQCRHGPTCFEPRVPDYDKLVYANYR
jgi:hypothetical protein